MTANGYLGASSVNIMLYDDAFSPIFFDQKNAGMKIIRPGNRITPDDSLRLLRRSPMIRSGCGMWSNGITPKDTQPLPSHHR